MAVWALVEKSLVREVTTTDPTGRYHALMQWVADAPANVAIGWSHVAGVFSPPGAAIQARTTVIPSLSFLNRLTPAEDTAIHTAALGNAQLLSYLTRLGAATVVDLKDPVTAAGLDALVAAGLLTADRKVALLTP